jgi:hypothetical protein
VSFAAAFLDSADGQDRWPYTEEKADSAQANPQPAAQPAATPAAAPEAAAPPAATKLPPEQLESLVAPIALYPDALLAQTLVASTYPLEIIQLQQWLSKHKDLKDKALADSVAKQPWDPSIQSMAATPEVVERLANDIQWTTELGNAFLAQQGDVMDAAQRMRKKAQDNGALKSNEQQKVETKVVENKTVIVVESTNPEVIYVPSYSPTVVYGPPVYPYPPIYYPPYPPGAAFVSFGMGMMWGAAIWGGSCCGCGWGGNNTVIINNNNHFNNINRGDGGLGNRGDGGLGNRGDGGRGNRGDGGTWKHNPQHRGGAPYGDKATADRFGGSTRGGVADRSAGTRPQSGRQPGSAGGQPGVGDRSRPGGGTSPANRGGAGGAGGSDRIGNRDIPRGNESRSGGGFSSGSRGYNKGGASSSWSRGSGSRGGRGGGGRGGRR